MGLEVVKIDVSSYADPKFSWNQMEEIRKGLEKGLDVSIYAHIKFSAPQMEQIRYGLEYNLDVSSYANPEYGWTEMRRSLQTLIHESELNNDEYI